MIQSPVAQAQLRPMRWWDVPQVCALEAQLFPMDAWTAEMFWAELAQVGTSRAVAILERDSEIIGYAALRWSGREADINTIAVAAHQQGKGFGRMLLTWLEDEAGQRKVEQIFLEVRSDNQPALQLYQDFDFEAIDVRKNYYGPEVSAVVMRKRLKYG